MVVRYRWEEGEEWWGVVRGGEAVGGIGGEWRWWWDDTKQEER